MLFKRKKRMIDVRELQKRGVVRIPKKDIVPTNREGFVEFGTNHKPQTNDLKANSQQLTANSELFGFMDTTPTNSQLPTQNSQLSASALDNKIYKLEQRIELLEKKLEIDKPTKSNLGPMGW